MSTRKPKSPELAAASANLAEAAQHVRLAVSQKFDEIGAAVSAELDKAKLAAVTKRGRARRKFDALLKKAEGRLTKATDKARKSLAKAVRDAEKAMEATKAATRTELTELKRAAGDKAATAKREGAKVVSKNVVAKKVVAKKVAEKKPVAKKAVAPATEQGAAKVVATE